MNSFQKNESKETFFSPVSTEEVPPPPPSLPKKPPPVSPQIHFCLWQEQACSFGSLPWFLRTSGWDVIGIKNYSFLGLELTWKPKQVYFTWEGKQQEEIVKIFIWNPGLCCVSLYVYSEFLWGEEKKKQWESPGKLGKHSCPRELCVIVLSLPI